MADARALCLSVLERAGVPVNGPEPWSIHVHDERVWERVAAERNLGLGESYMDGWWDCERLDEMLARVLGSGAAAAIRPGPKVVAMAVRSAVVNRQTKQRAKHNASHHYDIGNDLYERMLDKRMIYSCADWRNAHDLDTAQEAKLDLICRKLHLEPGLRLLDVGCGWGGFVQFAAERYGVEAVGVSPAGAQVELARARVDGLPVEIRQCDYRDVHERFDRIVSVGMLEHVGPRNFGRFFEMCDRNLAPGGVMLHHFIGSTASNRHSDAWFDRYIFPGGILPSLSQMARGAEPAWVVEDVQNLGPEYDLTLMAWHRNVEAAWPALPAYDERFRRMWRYYLLSSAAGFRSRHLQLWQMVFRRRGPADRYVPVR